MVTRGFLEIPPNFLVGKQLTQVTLEQHSIRVDFGDVWLVVQSHIYQLVKAQASSIYYVGQPSAYVPMLLLIGETVVSSYAPSAEEYAITFLENQLLRIGLSLVSEDSVSVFVDGIGEYFLSPV